MRRAGSLALLALALASPAAAHAQGTFETVAEGAAGADFGAHRGTVVWQARGGDGRYGLKALLDGSVRDLPVKKSARPFTGLDIGASGGSTAVVFGRCGTRAGSCNVHRIGLASGREGRQPGASRPRVDEAFPALSSSRIAYSGVDRFRDGSIGPGGNRILVSSMSGRGRTHRIRIPTRRNEPDCGGALRSSTPLIGFDLQRLRVLYQLFYFGRGCERDLLVERNLSSGRGRLVAAGLRSLEGGTYSGFGVSSSGFGPRGPFRVTYETDVEGQRLSGLRIASGDQIFTRLRLPDGTEGVEVDGQTLYRSECAGDTCRILRATDLRVLP